jgi:hypothetical protein
MGSKPFKVQKFCGAIIVIYYHPRVYSAYKIKVTILSNAALRLLPTLS